MEQQTEVLPIIEQPNAGLNGDLQHSRDFGDKRVYPNTQTLRDLRERWLERREKDFGDSPRAQQDIDRMLGRLTFELGEREREEQQ